MKRKQLICLAAAFAFALTGSLPAAAASYDYRFNVDEYEFYYPVSSQKVTHDGHGNFTVEDSPSLITSDDGYTTVIYPEDVTQPGYPVAPGAWQGSSAHSSPITLADGSIGHLSIPSIGLSCNVYEGETNSSMAKGVGHFSSTSAWDGNVALAGHNRGSAAYFGRLKNIQPGALITYSTAYGTRQYSVSSIRTVSSADYTPLYNTVENRLTLITCIENDYSVRLCVTADEVVW